MIYAFNKQVAVEAPEKRAVETRVVNGVRAPVQRVGLTALKVVYGPRPAGYFDSNATFIPEGSTVYVPTALFNNQKWATESVEFQGKQLLFVPESVIVLVEAPEPRSWAAETKMPGVNYSKAD